MSESGKTPISAQVIVAGLNKVKTDELNKILHKSGFDVGSFVGSSFSITASQPVFEKFLKASIYREEDGVCGFVLNGKKVGIELKKKFLPEIIKDKVLAITFTLPPDFGPANW